jgi:hypothetical protein
VSRQVPDDAPIIDAPAIDTPTINPEAVREEYWRQRALRRAKIERRRRTKRAGARFWVVLLLLLAVFGLLALTTWREIGQLFGL